MYFQIVVKIENLIKFICKLFSIGMNVLDFEKEFLLKMYNSWHVQLYQNKNPFEIGISSSFKTKNQIYGMEWVVWGQEKSKWNGVSWYFGLHAGDSNHNFKWVS